MPLYDFRCRACGAEFEALVMSGRTPACTSCQATDLDRLPSSFAVSSAEKTRAAATVKRQRQATTAYRDNIAREREADAHRKEDH